MEITCGWKLKIFTAFIIFITIFFGKGSIIFAQESSTIVATVAISICGNGIVETGEVCDSGNLNNNNCSNLGYPYGELRCEITCDEFDTSSCSDLVSEKILEAPTKELASPKERVEKKFEESVFVLPKQNTTEKKSSLLDNKQEKSLQSESIKSDVSEMGDICSSSSKDGSDVINKIFLGEEILSKAPT